MDQFGEGDFLPNTIMDFSYSTSPDLRVPAQQIGGAVGTLVLDHSVQRIEPFLGLDWVLVLYHPVLLPRHCN